MCRDDSDGFTKKSDAEIPIIPVTISIALSSGSIKKPGISIADAIIASTAREMQAVVVTGDPHFSEMGMVIKKYR